MLFGDIEEKDKYFSETPGYRLDWTTPSMQSYEGPPDYNFLKYDNQYDTTDDRGRNLPAQDSSFLAPAVTGNVMGAQPKAQASSGPSFRERVAAYLAGQNPYQVYTEQQSQRELMEMRKKQAERQALHEGLQAINQATKIPAGSLRKAYLDSISKQYQKLTGDEDTGMFDLLKKASDEEFEALVGSLQEYATATNLGIKDIRGLASNPTLLKEVLSGSTERMKAQREMALNEQMLKDFSGSTGTPQGAPANPTAPSTSQPSAPSQGAPGQPQRAPQGTVTVGPGQDQVRQKIIAAARQKGLGDDDVRALLAIGWQETKFQNIDNYRKDPRDGIGIYQFTPGTGAQYGIPAMPRRADGTPDPADPRFNVDKNINAAVDLYIANKKRTGSIDGAIAAHNGDTTGVYLGKVKGHYGRFGDLRPGSNTTAPSGRPSSQAVQTQATDDDAAAIQTQKQRIQEAQGKIDRLSKYVLAGNQGAQRTVAALQKEREDAQKELGRLESVYNEKNKPDEMSIRAAKDLGIDKPYTQWTTEERKAVAAHRDQYEINFNAQKSKAASDATKQNQMDVAAAGNQNRIITDHERYRGADGKQMGPGVTWDEASKKNAEWAATHEGKPYWTKTEKMTGKEREEIRERTIFVDRIQEIADNVNKIITGPVAGRLDRIKQQLDLKDRDKATDEQTALNMLLDQIINDRGFAQGGKTLPPQELERIKSALPSKNDPPDVFRAKTNEALKLAHQYHRMHISGLEEEGFTGLNTYRRGDPRYAQTPTPPPTQSPAPSEKDAANPLAKWKKK